jgi:superfamily II DNA or RNA helicase
MELRELSDASIGRVAILAARIGSYDPSGPEAAHLRGHQIEAIQRFRDVATAILNGDTSNDGMAILHPTGSGKTVTTAEITRMICGETSNDDPPLRALMLVPGHKILHQTTGDEDELGAIRTFATNVTVAEYSGKRKNRDALVTVMTYQALPWALERGDIDVIDPSIVICDEAHHVIDGTWAKAVETISRDKLLVGLTATPVYSSARDVSRLFPKVLVRKTMKEGIEEGMLSEMRGFVYRGASRISISRKGADFAEEDLFEAIANSEDNYLAAKICAREVEMGRRGVVSCVPGFDRAHAKIVAKILSETRVNTPEGVRNIRAAFVGGEVHERTLEKIFKEYREGKIDVITYVNLLLEGWDSPESDFTVLLRPTISRVLAEQRIGRIVRPREGKVAVVHEIVYDITGDAPDQITHLDILDETKIIQGHYFGMRKDLNSKESKRKYSQTPAHIFDVEDYNTDPDLALKIAELDAVPLDEVRVLCGQESIPFEWHTSHILAHKFNIDRDEVEKVLQQAKVSFRVEETESVRRMYYPPRASLVIAEHLGLEHLPEGAITVNELMRHHRDFRQYRGVNRRTIIQAVEEEGFRSQLYITENGQVVRAYPAESIDVPPVIIRDHKPHIHEAPKKEVEIIDNSLSSLSDTISWLNATLVNPDEIESNLYRREVQVSQTSLLYAIKKLKEIDPRIYKKLQERLSKLSIVPSPQMNNVMLANKLDFVGLVVAAINARSEINKRANTK